MVVDTVSVCPEQLVFLTREVQRLPYRWPAPPAVARANTRCSHKDFKRSASAAPADGCGSACTRNLA